ncbi:MAG: aryl-sulfate sulfotransferase [Planctomycetes bacterium]|nr:aryl-sulfate sulfotransferase [Planctomycetota bacterium]MCB9909805.1 aryl-sulfate sulfotransferase [Planctomycetota bacterium]MCB9912286.1 aryl-sulfate sulfotransferase [Planctomycetota bacterium]HPF14296.1 aryl-sulfate sulfotransferase [Planctomycetota bacterium]HRV79971.1 aryl-sulfate sulfotransferase [Planctomycetota bacterium]
MLFRTLGLFALSGLALAQSTPQPGITVYQPGASTTAYAVDLAGNVVNTWPGTTTPGSAVYMAPNGDLVRTKNLGPGIGGGGAGGGLERVSWDGQLLWDFSYDSATVHAHHDIALMPNGNVLMIAWEDIGPTLAIAAGRDPSTAGTDFWSEHIIEVEPDGNGGASVVWEWHAFDHLVQKRDPNLPNYDLPENRPERIHINYPVGNVGSGGDWLHFNGIDYNAELDQIVVSSRTMNEVWILDHSTTTLEAAGSTGGLRGRGGDLLYRWGNPEAYGLGAIADRQLYGQHDCQWIAAGLPGAGHLLVFNNGSGRPGGNYSSADEIVPPINSGGTYDLLPQGTYGPSAALASITHPSPMTFYSANTSGCQRLANGNTMLVRGDMGFFIEIDPMGALVWSFQNPFPAQGIKRTFKGRRHDGGVVGLAYCNPAEVNSTGVSGTLQAVGSVVPSENSLTLWAEHLPQGEFGFFLNGTGNSVTPMAGGSAGTLCLSNSIGRYNGIAQVFQVGAPGTASLALDLGNTPTPGGPVAVSAGQTWYFQCWYRDTPAMTSNFTNAVEVAF